MSNTYALSNVNKELAVLTGITPRPCLEVPCGPSDYGRKHEDPLLEFNKADGMPPYPTECVHGHAL